MKLNFRLIRAALMFASLSTFTAELSNVFAQGSLTPPGAPGPTFRTLQQVEPRFPLSVIPTNLTAPGSYYFTTNLTQTNNADGITISASDVTIDLNGFTLIGTNGGVAGISRSTIRSNIWIRNGSVRNWSVGVNMAGGGRARLEHLAISGNSSHGILTFDPITITECSVTENGGHGITASGAETIVRNCLVTQNELDGIRVGSAALVVGNFCNGLANSGSTNAGIRATSNRNRIENNHVSFYQSGFVISGSQNFVFRNTTANVGTNYIIAGGNSFGPTNTSSGVVTNHPWANFDL